MLSFDLKKNEPKKKIRRLKVKQSGRGSYFMVYLSGIYSSLMSTMITQAGPSKAVRYNQIVDTFNEGLSIEKRGNELFNKQKYSESLVQYRRAIEKYTLAKDNSLSLRNDYPEDIQINSLNKTVNDTYNSLRGLIVDTEAAMYVQEGIRIKNSGVDLFNRRSYSEATAKYIESISSFKRARGVCQDFLALNPGQDTVTKRLDKVNEIIQNTEKSVTKSMLYDVYSRGSRKFNEAVSLYNKREYVKALDGFNGAQTLFNDTKRGCQDYLNVSDQDPDFINLIQEIDANLRITEENINKINLILQQK